MGFGKKEAVICGFFLSVDKDGSRFKGGEKTHNMLYF